MKNHELLDLIGDVNEDYILEAGDNVSKPRFRWKALAACAACAALVLGAYPVYRLAAGGVNSECYARHNYTVVEGGGTLDTQNDVKAPANDASGTVAGEDDSGLEGIDGIGYNVPGQDVPVQEEAQARYSGLLQGLGGQGGYEPETYPDWYGGAWIDNSYYPEAKLAVAIVNGFRTDELDAQIEEWCGGEVVFKDVKYSWSHLDQLMTPISEVLKGTGLSCGFGVDVMENCLGVDLYGGAIPDEVLARLAALDPDGDAIRVRLFIWETISTDIVKGPDPNGEPDPLDEWQSPPLWVPPVENEAVPGGDTQPTAEEGEQLKEQDQAAVYDLLEPNYDAIAEGE